MKPMKKFIHNYIHCGLLGWFLEIAFTSFHAFRRRDYRLPGTTSVWMFPIYGMAAFLEPLSRLLRRRSFVLRGSVYTFLIFLGEYLTGSFLRRRCLCPWNYENSKWNFRGLIRLDYAPYWFLSGLLFERLLRENEYNITH